MNVRRYQKWAKSGLAIMLAGAMMVGTAASGGMILPAKKDINKVNVNGQLVKTILKDGKVFLPVLRSGVYHIVLN